MQFWKTPLAVADAEPRLIARERAAQIASVLEKLEDAGELSLAGQPPRLLLEEDPLHRRKIDLGRDAVLLLGPAREIDEAGHVGLHPIRFQIDVPQLDRASGQ